MSKKISKQEMERALRQFGLRFDEFDVALLDAGHINGTYHVTLKKNGAVAGEYVLQCINTYVFRYPELMMNNIARVTEHLETKLLEQGINPKRRVLHFLRNANGNNYTYGEKGHFWRCYRFVDHARTYNQVTDPTMLESAGRGFGEFQKLLADFPMDTLVETIPDFHNTKLRLRSFFKMVEEDPLGRVKSTRTEIEFFQTRKQLSSRLVDQQNAGILPLRVTHNDTKYNNILIDDDTHEAICVLDLDTVMPGLAAYDFGDAIRFAACTAAEDEKDLSKVSLDLELFEAFTRGFIGGAQGFFTESEIESMAWGARIMTTELAARFLLDYLSGDRYFKTEYPGHNLDRARAQIRLVEDMEKKFKTMQEIVRQYA